MNDGRMNLRSALSAWVVPHPAALILPWCTQVDDLSRSGNKGRYWEFRGSLFIPPPLVLFFLHYLTTEHTSRHSESCPKATRPWQRLASV